MNRSCCPICSTNTLNICYILRDDRYGFPGLFDLYFCAECGHKHLGTKFSNKELESLYCTYYPRSTFDIESHKPAQDPRGFSAQINGISSSAFCWVPENVKVLDIGCGLGESLRYHKTRGCEAYGVEADANVRRVADAYGLVVKVGLFDPSLYEAEFFDYVTMDQVIEHIKDPLAMLQGVFTVLKPGGKLIISTPNSNGWGAKVFGCRWINWHSPYHLQHFSLNSMHLAAKISGLIVDSYCTRTSSEWIYYQWLHLIAYPEMCEPSVFWSSKGKRGLTMKFLFKLLSVYHRTRFDHLLTRFFDTIGIGDNYLFFLSKP